MEHIAVIDTETNWIDQVMSIGCCIADDSYRLLDARYYILTPEFEVGGMYENTLFCDPQLKTVPRSREDVLDELTDRFSQWGVEKIFAYNASFDRNHLPELRYLQWYDIMRLAAYRQFNSAIPGYADCCRTGRLKRGYGVESMLRLLSRDRGYCETHNAMHDSIDELTIMRLLGHSLETYIPL